MNTPAANLTHANLAVCGAGWSHLSFGLDRLGMGRIALPLRMFAVSLRAGGDIAMIVLSWLEWDDTRPERQDWFFLMSLDLAWILILILLINLHKCALYSQAAASPRDLPKPAVCGSRRQSKADRKSIHARATRVAALMSEGDEDREAISQADDELRNLAMRSFQKVHCTSSLVSKSSPDLFKATKERTVRTVATTRRMSRPMFDNLQTIKEGNAKPDRIELGCCAPGGRCSV